MATIEITKRPRVLITGATGVVGKRLLETILSRFDTDKEIKEFEFLVAQADEGQTRLFEDSKDKIWISKNLDEATVEDWKDWIETNRINRVYFLESTENINRFLPLVNDNNRLDTAELMFTDYLETIYTDKIDNTNLEVVYFSTDKVYKRDKFPKETHDIIIEAPRDNMPIEEVILANYVNIKLLTEMKLQSMRYINSRIVRPFNVVASEQGADFPLSNMVIKTMFNGDLNILKNGNRGLTFTHVQDIVNFMVSPRLFNTDIARMLPTKIINVSRAWNYLSEALLIRKLKEKIPSKSVVIPNTTIDNFKHIIVTPQIRNMVKIYDPKITIDEMIEELVYIRSPQEEYEPLIIKQVYYTDGPTLHINGTGEANAFIIAYLGTGEILNCESDKNGVWEIVTDKPYVYEFESEAEIRITSKEGIQYQTEHVVIPSSVDWSPPDYQDLVVNRIMYKYTTESDPKPYLYMEGIFEPDGTIKIDLEMVNGGIHLESIADPAGGWNAETLPGFYNFSKGRQGTIKGYLPDGTLYTTYEFDIPITPDRPPATPPEANMEPVKVLGDEYRKEKNPPFAQYLQVWGSAEPGTKVIAHIPPSVNSELTDLEIKAMVNSAGKWELRTPAPYYLTAVNSTGYVEAYDLNNVLYSLTSFDIFASPTPPPVEPPPGPFVITSVYYDLDSRKKPHIVIEGVAPKESKIEVTLDNKKLSDNTGQGTTWKVKDPDITIVTDLNKYFTATRYLSDGTKKQTIKFRVPPSPIDEKPPEYIEEIIVHSVKHLQDVPKNPMDPVTAEYNYFEVTGKARKLGTVRIRYPNPADVVIVEEVKVNSEGEWRFESYRGYDKEYPRRASIEGLDHNGKFYAATTFEIPPAPKFKPKI